MGENCMCKYFCISSWVSSKIPPLCKILKNSSLEYKEIHDFDMHFDFAHALCAFDQ